MNTRSNDERPPVLEVNHVSVAFSVRQGAFRRSRHLQAVRDVSLSLAEHETYGLVGESGSGKSTLGRAILRLVEPNGGTVRLAGSEVTGAGRRQLRSLRRDMQMVFQDPYSSLDSSAVVEDIVAEPLIVHDRHDRQHRQRRVHELLELVGLPSSYASRYPYEFSGGQRQRIAIARAIALNPKLVILDEAVSALDVSTQNQVLELLARLRSELGLAYLFIAHDLSVVRWLADTTAVMYLGQIVEEGPTERVYTRPAHPYTEALLSAVPIPDPEAQRQRQRIVLRGELPDPLDPPSGCSFRTRCPYAMEICAKRDPQVGALADGGWVACHLHTHKPGTRIVPGTKQSATPSSAESARR